MRAILFLIFTIGIFGTAHTQTYTEYSVSFENRLYNEARISVTFRDVPDGPFSVRMSRTSPGRYALHEFAKNVYLVSATDSKGDALAISRPDPHQWDITGHDRTVTVTYTLFADRGDGTYSEFDGTHAHMNIPATFMWAPGMEHRPIRLKISIPDNSNWRVSTQLKEEGNHTFSAPDLYYFMDSPIEVSDHMVRSEKLNSGNKEYEIRLALHHTGTEEEADEYFRNVMKIVRKQMEVYGELPDFDFGTYTFLACYTPGASGDGMEHRNSTIVTSTRSLANGGMSGNLGTISHEFFHAWNVERIRPRSLEPFDFNEANMSGELWFAEGFTSYYTGLILCRADLQSESAYIKSLMWTLNSVINGSGRKFFSPVEMSYQAPFVDAARSVDPTNRGTTFISYYTYGSALGLALDLALRNKGQEWSLDGYMQQVWNTYGKKEIPYNVEDLASQLAEYAGQDFSDDFFENYIYKPGIPEYSKLLSSVGVILKPRFPGIAWIGVEVESGENGWTVQSRPDYEGPAYNAGLAAGDMIIEFNGMDIKAKPIGEVLSDMKPGQEVSFKFERQGKKYNRTLTLGERPDLEVILQEESGGKLDKDQQKMRDAWLGKE